MDEKRLEEIRSNLTKLIDRQPEEAKNLYNLVIHPLLVNAVQVVAHQDDLLLGAEEEDAVMLACNAALIVRCKEKGVDIPNLDLIAKDARERIQAKYKEAKLREKFSI
jgi:hypothetical protein